MHFSKIWIWLGIVAVFALSSEILFGRDNDYCRHISNGTPGSLGSNFGSLGGVEISNHEEANGPALDILHRGGVKRGRRIAGLVLHNYSLGPAIQVDMTGQGGGNHQASKKPQTQS